MHGTWGVPWSNNVDWKLTDRITSINSKLRTVIYFILDLSFIVKYCKNVRIWVHSTHFIRNCFLQGHKCPQSRCNTLCSQILNLVWRLTLKAVMYINVNKIYVLSMLKKQQAIICSRPSTLEMVPHKDLVNDTLLKEVFVLMVEWLWGFLTAITFHFYHLLALRYAACCSVPSDWWVAHWQTLMHTQT